ncbi:MAG TPA: polymer-forming cytoskeletal protein [Prosthecobacter sp.]
MTASSVTRSGMGMPNPWAKPAPAQETPPAPEPPQPPAAETSPPPPAKAGPVAAELSQPVTAEEEAEGGFGVFLKQQSGASGSHSAPAQATVSEALPPAAPAPVQTKETEVTSAPEAASEKLEQQPSVTRVEEDAEPPQISLPASISEAAPEVAASPVTSSFRRPQSNSPAPTSAPAPMSSSTLQKMKNEGMYRNQYFKDAECFECSHRFKVSRSSRSAECPNCGAAIPLEDVEINMPTSQSIRTRGDVLIRKRGQVSAELIQCKDLRCQGILEAHVSASGDAIFRTTGTMIGEVRCRRFIVEKGSDVTFEHEIRADEVEIHARITGTIFSSGPFIIGSGGSVNGDLTARSVSIEPGGELNGAMNIVRTQRPVVPQPPPEAAEEA